MISRREAEARGLEAACEIAVALAACVVLWALVALAWWIG